MPRRRSWLRRRNSSRSGGLGPCDCGPEPHGPRGPDPHGPPVWLFHGITGSYSMIPKSGTRFSEKIMLNNITTAAFAAGGLCRPFGCGGFLGGGVGLPTPPFTQALPVVGFPPYFSHNPAKRLPLFVKN